MANRKAQGGSQLLSIFVPMLVICVLGVGFGIIVADLGQNYGVSYDDSSYNTIVNQTTNINSITQGTSESVLGEDEGRSNILSSTERLVTGAYNAILVLGDIPGIYAAIITVIADSVGIPSSIVNLVLAGILFSIVAVVIYLALGRI
jgi:hypothetical protein